MNERSMEERARAMAAAYDAEAAATGWRGPEVALGLALEYVRPGESILDLGIGTGLVAERFRGAGLRVVGVDVDAEMLEACRAKGFADLRRHDLNRPPYPFAGGSFDHAVCTGSLDFLGDLSPVFAEVARILRPGGVFVFTVGDRGEGQAGEHVVTAERTGTGAPVTMYRYSRARIDGWLQTSGFILVRDLAFAAFMDRERTLTLPQHAYLARRD